MLVNRGERGQLQTLGHFFIAGDVAVLFDEVRGKIQDFLLPLGESHELILGEQKGKVKGLVLGRTPPVTERPSHCPTRPPSPTLREDEQVYIYEQCSQSPQDLR